MVDAPRAEQQCLRRHVQLESRERAEPEDHELDPEAKGIPARSQHRLELREREHEPEQHRDVQQAPVRRQPNQAGAFGHLVDAGERAQPHEARPGEARGERDPRAALDAGVCLGRRLPDERGPGQEDRRHAQELERQSELSEEDGIRGHEQDRRERRFDERR